MALTRDTWMPSDEELTVPQEITLSTAWLKAVAPYMNLRCEEVIKEFMLRRAEYEDPRKTIKEGREVTSCGVKFLRDLKKTCANEAEKLANCIDTAGRDQYISGCREEQLFMDNCMQDKMDLKKPKVGHYSKLHVHNSTTTEYKHPMRDYKAEAAKVVDSLPTDWKIRQDYRDFREWIARPFSDK